MRVVERRQHLRLAREACDAIGIEGKRVGDDLQRDVAIQLGIARTIHLAHAAGAEGRANFIRTESGARGERQTRAVEYTGGPSLEPYSSPPARSASPDSPEASQMQNPSSGT